MQVTVVRATRYTDDQPAQPQEHPWRPVLDVGELRFGFLLTTDLAALPRLAAELEDPPLVAHVVAAPGDGSKTGGFLSLQPASVRLLAVKPAEDGGGWILRLQSCAEQVVTPQVTWMGQILSLAPLPPRALGTWLLRRSEAGGWNAAPTDLMERRIQQAEGLDTLKPES